MAEILLVEDDAVIGRLVTAALQSDGHVVTWVRLGGDALRSSAASTLDLVLLDIGLPDIDGLVVCRQLRQRLPHIVLVMLTARRDEMDVIEGLEAGADDYLTKPFGVAELLARVRAHLRRSAAPAEDEEPIYRIGDLTVNAVERRCQVGDREVRLRSKEFDLLARLAKAAGQALSRETLMADVWATNWFGSTKTLDVHVAAVRRQLNDAAEQVRATHVEVRLPDITTLRGFGYRLEADPTRPTPS